MEKVEIIGLDLEVFEEKSEDNPDPGWRWRLRAPNGRVIANSGESFTEKNDAEESFMTLIRTIEQRPKNEQSPPTE